MIHPRSYFIIPLFQKYSFRKDVTEDCLNSARKIFSLPLFRFNSLDLKDDLSAVFRKEYTND